MDDREFASLEDTVDAYARRLEKRIRALEAHGRDADGYEKTAREIRIRQRTLELRVAEAIRAGKFWGIVKAELARDYNSLFDNFLSLERQIDRSFVNGGAAHHAHGPHR